ncbi:MAG: AAA family ATPase, partial [Bilophila sp.]
MRIRAFHIDAFGLLRDMTVEGLPAGFSIFLGHNEAGKSTLLDFFRSTLTGYPRSTSEREKGYLAGNNVQFGGSLQLDTEHGFLRLTRRPGVAGGVPTLTDSTGNPVDVTLWERLLGGVTREVYTNVYGFSLAELQSFASLTSEGVRNALYGASFGMGLRSPGAAFKRLDKSMEDLFKPKGSQQLLSGALRAWEEIRKEIHSGEDALAQYDTFSAALEERLARLATVRGDSKELARERRTLERRLGVWRQWEEWRLTGARLDRLESVSATFPQDGPARLERALERQESAERTATLSSERLEHTRKECEACVVDEALLRFREEVRGLAECKSSCRNALVTIPGLKASLLRVDADTKRELATLGSDWTFARVAHTERPLALREAIERQASEMLMADSGHVAAGAALEKAIHDLDAAQTEVAAAQKFCESLPEPVADLDESSRETLRSLLARTEEAHQRLPDREKALTSARGEFGRALNHLHLRPRQNTAQALTALSDAQDDILGLSGAVLQQMSVLAGGKRLAEQARDAEEQARSRRERLKNQQDDLGDSNRDVLDTQRATLRRLRAVLAQQTVEESRLAEAKEQYAAHMAEAPGTESSPALIGVGVVLGLMGSGALIARQFMGLQSLEITPEFVFPLELWLGYLILLAGIAFVWAG